LATDAEAVDIVVVEDDPTDIILYERSWKRAPLDATRHMLTDGGDALDLLQTLVRDLGKPLPIVVTDLNLPGLDGFALIERIRNDAQLRRCLVFVVSSSHLREDIERAYALGVAGYVNKDDDTRAVASFLCLLGDMLRTLELPHVLKAPTGLVHQKPV